MAKYSQIVLLVSIFLLGNCQVINSRPQSVPDQVQKFFQTNIFNPIRDRVKDGVQEIGGIISHYSNLTQGTGDSSSSSPPTPSVTNAPSGSVENGPTQSLADLARIGQKTSSDDAQLAQRGDSNANITGEIVLTNKSTDSKPDFDQNQGEIVTLKSTTTTSKPNSNIDEEAPYLSTDSIMQLRKLCPSLASLDEYSDERILKVKYLYFEETGQCYVHGRRGPCNLGMQVFIKEQGSYLGQCGCATNTLRLNIYHEESNSCYPIFSQGYCPEGQWIDLTQSWQPICTENPCAINTTNAANTKDNKKPDEYVFIKGQCAKLRENEGGICGPDKKIVVKFVKNRRTPKCTEDFDDVVTGGGIIPCQPGNSIAIHGKCHVSEWEFGDDEPKEEKKSSN